MRPVESKAVNQELFARQLEYHEHPERFVRMDAKDLNKMFQEIDEEVRETHAELQRRRDSLG